MDPKDERLEPVMNFAMKSFRLDPEQWWQSVSDDDNLVTINAFFSGQDHGCLFICQDTATPALETLPGLRFCLGFPRDVRSKVVSVSKPSRVAVTKDSAKSLIFAELPGEDALSLVTALTEEMALPLLRNRENSAYWPGGMSKEVLRHMELQKKQTVVMKEQTQGRIFLPQPGLCKDTSCLGLEQDQNLQIEDYTEKAAPSSICQSELLQACDWTIVEWAELVSDFLKQDSCKFLLEQTRPLPEEEFNFWENRLQNLVFINQQLKSPGAQHVAAVVQNAQSVHASTLKQICSSVQDGLMEAEDVTQNLRPLQKILDRLQTLDYHQLKDQMETVMEEVRLVWTRSRSYCKPCRIVVLLQEICNLFIHLSRSFLGRGQVLRGLAQDPGPVLEAVCLCIATLERLKECFRQCRTQLEAQGGNTPPWDFPLLLIFVHLDLFLQRLERIREVHRITLDLTHLNQAVFSGVTGRKWTGLLQELYEHFLNHVIVLSETDCDATDPDDQVFPGLWARFQSQVGDVESHLVTVFSRALETCTTSSSAAKIVQMFELVLSCPLIRDKLHPQFNLVWNMIQAELDQTELTAKKQIRAYKQSHVPNLLYSGFRPSAVSAMIWSQQLELRVQDTFKNHLLVRAVNASKAQLVSERSQSLMKQLQDFRDSVQTEWTEHLEEDCAFILEQPVIQLQHKGILEVPCGPKLESILRELRFVTWDQEVKLRPQAFYLFTCRDDITETHLSLNRLQSCYNQVLTSVDQVELPLIQAQLQELNHSLSGLQTWSWRSEGLLREVQRQKDKVLNFHQIATEARAKTAAIKRITQGWGQIQLLQRKEDGLLRDRATETSQLQLSQDAQELLRLTQDNMVLYSADEASEGWLSYLDHIDDVVQSGLVQLLHSALSFLTLNMKSPGLPLLSVTLVLESQGSHFIPSDLSPAGGVMSVEQRLSSIVSELYGITDLVPRISTRRNGNYQSDLKQSPPLTALEQEVRSQAKEVSEKAEHLRVELDSKYARLWTSNRQKVMQEFLTYGRQLDPDEQEVAGAPPTLREFKREVQSLQSVRSALSTIDDITVLQGWLEVDLQPFRDSVMSLSDEWSHMFTERLLQMATDSFHCAAPGKEDQPESSFPLTQTLLLLVTSGVELPPPLSTQIHC